MPTKTLKLSGAVFLDTNVLIYAAQKSNKVKQKRARELINELSVKRQAVISSQVVSEFISIARKKLGCSDSSLRRLVAKFAAFKIVSIDFEDTSRALEVSILNKISYWDALIIVAAKKSKCSLISTEDLNSGQQIEGMVIFNPF